MNVDVQGVKCRNRLFETQASFQKKQVRPRARGIGCVWGTNRDKSAGVYEALGTVLDTVFLVEGQSGKLIVHNLPCGSYCQPPYQGNTFHCLLMWMIQVKTEQVMSIFSNTYVIPCWMEGHCFLPAGNPGFGRWLKMLP